MIFTRTGVYDKNMKVGLCTNTFNTKIFFSVTPGPNEISLSTHSTVKQKVKVKFM